MESLNEEGVGGVGAISPKPEGRREREKTVLGSQITLEVGNRVNDKAMFLNDGGVTLKELVSFMTREEKAVVVLRYGN